MNNAECSELYIPTNHEIFSGQAVGITWRDSERMINVQIRIPPPLEQECSRELAYQKDVFTPGTLERQYHTVMSPEDVRCH